MADSREYKYPIEADNFYELLKLAPLSNPSGEQLKEKYNERYNYWKSIAKQEMLEDKTRALNKINEARNTLAKPEAKQKYDAGLRKIMLKRLDKNIEMLVKNDKELDHDEEQDIYKTGHEEYGLTQTEISDRIDFALQNFKAQRVKIKTRTQNFDTPQPSPITLEGQPILEIVDDNSEFKFSDVKLGHTESGSFIIKNGGGGSLEAEVISSAAWLIASPTTIHQSQLPQRVTIIVDPSKDKRCQHGFRDIANLRLVYNQGNQTKAETILVDFSIEGFEQTVNRFTKISTGVAAGIVGLYLWYLFNVLNISGWGFFGLLVSLGAGIYGYFAHKERNKLNRNLAIAATALLILLASPTLFIAVLTIPLTFYASKFVFSRYPLKPQLAGIIPVSIFLVGWVSDGLINGDFRFPNFNKRPQVVASVEQPSYLMGTITATEGAKLRSQPSKNSYVLSTLKKGAIVTILESTGEWYKVQYQNFTTGYIFSPLVSVSGLSQNTAQALRPQVIKPILPPPTASLSRSSSEKTKIDSIQITISSTPTGAVVQFDSNVQGLTPDTVTVKSGLNIIQLTHAGYKDYKDSIFVKADGKKNFHFKLNPLSRLLVGRWEGVLAQKRLIMVITSYDGAKVTGYTDTPDSNKTHFLGTFDSVTGLITLEEQDEGIGKYTGKLSDDRMSMIGTWMSSKGTEQTYDWSVRFAPNLNKTSFGDVQNQKIRSLPLWNQQTWSGYYECQQGRTSLRLIIQSVSGQNINALFDFNYSNGQATGVFALNGQYNPATRRLLLTPVRWINNPNGYSAVGMDGVISPDGKRYAGKITDGACKGFELSLNQ